MTTLNRLVVNWAGPAVTGLAVSVLHFDGSDNAAPPVAAVKAAFEAAKLYIANGTTLTFPGSGDQIDDTSGELTGTWTSPDGGIVTSSAAPGAAAGVGACLGWSTGGIVNGRRLRGRTFIVPLSRACYDVDGTLVAEAYTALDTLAAAIQAAGPLAVWHRPTNAPPTNGNSYGVVAHKVRDKVAYLSSRRD